MAAQKMLTLADMCNPDIWLADSGASMHTTTYITGMMELSTLTSEIDVAMGAVARQVFGYWNRGDLGLISKGSWAFDKNCDFILAEDTRNSIKLIKHYGIEKPLYAYHMHNEHHSTEKYIQQLQQDITIAVISDSGTPGISDPGFLMIRACIENQIPFECLPGATAFVPALLLSGFPNHEFLFVGFLPPKKGRKTLLEKLSQEKRTLIFYESPHKINTTVSQIATYFGPETQISISREITKLFEETIRGNAQEVLEKITQKPLKGEIVLVVNGAS